MLAGYYNDCHAKLVIPRWKFNDGFAKSSPVSRTLVPSTVKLVSPVRWIVDSRQNLPLNSWKNGEYRHIGSSKQGGGVRNRKSTKGNMMSSYESKQNCSIWKFTQKLLCLVVIKIASSWEEIIAAGYNRCVRLRQRLEVNLQRFRKKWPSEERWYTPTCVTPGVTARGRSISIHKF